MKLSTDRILTTHTGSLPRAVPAHGSRHPLRAETAAPFCFRNRGQCRESKRVPGEESRL